MIHVPTAPWANGLDLGLGLGLAPRRALSLAAAATQAVARRVDGVLRCPGDGRDPPGWPLVERLRAHPALSHSVVGAWRAIAAWSLQRLRGVSARAASSDRSLGVVIGRFGCRRLPDGIMARPRSPGP
jgi:hypothetical protein